MATLYNTDGTSRNIEVSCLKDLQTAVGGLIEEFTFAGQEPDYAYLCNEEGHLLGLERNVRFQWIAGPVLKVKVTEEFK